MNPIRVVLDTNVYISAALNPDSLLYRLVEDSTSQNLAEYYTSPEIIAELQDKLENKFHFDRKTVVRWINRLEQSVNVIRPQKKLAIVKADPDDNKILECAAECQADLIISADKHLVSMKIYENTKIIQPSSLKYIFPQLKKPRE
jgi:putative PIN family toxin of toxin-antitoxin system